MKTVKVSLEENQFERAARFAVSRGMVAGGRPEVATIMRMALSAYLSKYGVEADKRATRAAKSERRDIYQVSP